LKVSFWNALFGSQLAIMYFIISKKQSQGRLRVKPPLSSIFSTNIDLIHYYRKY